MLKCKVFSVCRIPFTRITFSTNFLGNFCNSGPDLGSTKPQIHWIKTTLGQMDVKIQKLLTVSESSLCLQTLSLCLLVFIVII